MDGLINEHSQLHKVIQGVSSLGLRHADTARVGITGVRVAPNFADGRRTAFFCQSDFELLELLEKGDGGELPEEIIVKSFGDLPDGNWCIEALVTSNGVINLERVLSPVSPPESKIQVNETPGIPESRLNFVNDAHMNVPPRALVNEVQVTADN